MKKKILSLCLVVALAATAIVGASMAYLTDEESEVNVMTLGNVQITQNEHERGESGKLVNFTDNQVIYPAVFDDYSSKEDLDANGWTVKIRDKVENYVDKIVSVTNDGASEAYVRTIIAFPEAGNFDTTYNSAEQWLHWNGVSDTDTDPGNGWMWGVKDNDGNYIEWPGNNNTWDVVENVTIGDKVYDIYVATNENVLEPGKTTAPSLLGFYLDPGVDFDGTNYTFGSYNLGDISNLEILVATQAVQAAGFDDAWTALDEAFGDITATNHPWTKTTLVSSIGDLITAMNNGGEVILTADLNITEDNVEFRSGHYITAVTKDTVIDLNGYNITVDLGSDYASVSTPPTLFYVYSGATLTIVGDGNLSASNDACLVWARSDSAGTYIYGGNWSNDNYTTPTKSTDAMAIVYSSGGPVNIYGGTFTYELYDNGSGDCTAFNVQNSNSYANEIVLHEGVLLSHETFCQPSDNGRIALAEGCELQAVEIDGVTWYQVVKA